MYDLDYYATQAVRAEAMNADALTAVVARYNAGQNAAGDVGVLAARVELKRRGVALPA